MLKLGQNVEISNSDYHGDREYISSSGLKLLLKDEKEFHKQYIQGIRQEGTDFFDFGTYIHALILEPHTVENDFAVYSGAVKRGKMYEEFKSNNTDKVIVTKKEQDQGIEIMKKFESSKLCKQLISDGVPEDTYCAILDGLKVKVRTDYLKTNSIVDVKTTSFGIDKESLESTCIKYDYDLSAALYLDTVNECKNWKNEENIIKNFYFLFVNKRTNDIIAARATTSLIENGRRKYKAAIKKYKRLKAEGFFDKKELEESIIDIDLPGYGRFE